MIEVYVDLTELIYQCDENQLFELLDHVWDLACLKNPDRSDEWLREHWDGGEENG